jgi:hypothetical protein
VISNWAIWRAILAFGRGGSRFIMAKGFLLEKLDYGGIYEKVLRVG